MALIRIEETQNVIGPHMTLGELTQQFGMDIIVHKQVSGMWTASMPRTRLAYAHEAYASYASNVPFLTYDCQTVPKDTEGAALEELCRTISKASYIEIRQLATGWRRLFSKYTKSVFVTVAKGTTVTVT